MKYDENFSSFIKASAFSQINQLTTGFPFNLIYSILINTLNFALGVNLSRFPIFMINLERFIELLSFTNKIANEIEFKSNAKKTKSDHLNLINSKETLLEAIKNQNFRVLPEESSVLEQILKESIEKEIKLNEEISSLLSKMNAQPQYITESNAEKVKASTDPHYYMRIIDEVRDLYKEAMNKNESDIKDLSTKVTKSCKIEYISCK